jgi:hypothetical protein
MNIITGPTQPKSSVHRLCGWPEPQRGVHGRGTGADLRRGKARPAGLREHVHRLPPPPPQGRPACGAAGGGAGLPLPRHPLWPGQGGQRPPGLPGRVRPALLCGERGANK